MRYESLVEVQQEFWSRLRAEWLPAYCNDPGRCYAVEGFRADAKQVTDLDVLVRTKEKARTEFESKLKESEKKLDEVTRSVGDQSKMQARIDQLEKDVKAERTKLDEANVTIVERL